MKLTLSVPLIWTLFSTAEALKCGQDPLGFNDGRDKVPESCTSFDEQCITVALQVFRDNELRENIIRKTCAPSSLCKDNQTFSITFYETRLTSSLQCCSTDGCNTKDIPYPDEQKPNGLQCLTCGQSCLTSNQTLQCVGVQDRCVSVNVTDSGETFQLHGCVSANLCEGHTELKLRALFDRSIHGEGLRFSAPECCGTSLCNKLQEPN